MAETTIEVHRPVPIRHIAAVVIGNALEFYDFLTYAFFAVYIGRTFFPSATASSSLLLSLATFGAGFITRPIGAIIIGSMGDRMGRKPAMLLSFSLMGIAIVGLALTPSYAMIGAAAPILVLCFRLLQGFALGGEVGPTTAYLIEAAPPLRRGFYGSLQYATQDLAVLSAGVVGVVLANTLDAQQLQDWGWRIAFLIGAAIVPFGLLIRRNLPETLHAADDAALAPDATRGTLTTRQKLKPHTRVLVLGLLLLTSGTMGSYVTNYMTTYAIATLHMLPGIAFGATVVTGLAGLCFEPLSGILSDKFGRKPVFLIPGALTLLCVVPSFWAIEHFRNASALLGATGLLSILAALSTPPVIIALTESLPPSIRSGAVATVYAFAISIFGGSTQFTITWLIGATGSPLAPAWYWAGALVLGLVAMSLMRESAPIKDRHGRA